MSTFNIALTGHRPNKLAGYNLDHPFYKALQQELEHQILIQLEHHDFVHCHSGMALGADTVWAQAIVAMKSKFPNRVMFTAHIPCENQESRWPADSQKHYHALLEHADHRIIYETHYTSQCMQKRNIGMIDASNGLLAIWDGTPGGTGNTVRAAQNNNHPVHILHPDQFRV